VDVLDDVVDVDVEHLLEVSALDLAYLLVTERPRASCSHAVGLLRSAMGNLQFLLPGTPLAPCLSWCPAEAGASALTTRAQQRGPLRFRPPGAGPRSAASCRNASSMQK